MALTAEQIRLLNKMNTTAARAKLGDVLATAETGAARTGVHVPNAAGAPTQSEFNALLTSLRNAGLIASS